MKILVNKNAGVCWGVERAMEMADETIAQKQHEGQNPVASLGPLVHNPEVINDFNQRGVQVIQTLEDVESGTVIFRSHGVDLDLYKKAEARGLDVVDATCPFVKRSQNYGRRFSRMGYTVIVVGDENHPEMKSVRSFIEGKYIITMDPKDVEKIPADHKVGVIAQTTIPSSVFKSVIDACEQRFSEVRTHDTICDATKIRQREAAVLARQVDCMIIIGGKNSSNTKKLLHICLEIQPRSYQIEHEREIDFSWFKNVNQLGVTAGASTPIPVIERVCRFIADRTSHRGALNQSLSKAG